MRMERRIRAELTPLMMMMMPSSIHSAVGSVLAKLRTLQGWGSKSEELKPHLLSEMTILPLHEARPG